MDKTALFKVSYGLYVVGVRNEDGFGGCIIDAFMQATDTPPTAVLSNGQRTVTNALIKRSKEFTLSILPSDVDPMIIANFGFQSGRTADKWANVSHELRGGLPVLTCACASLRLQVTDLRELSTHTLFFCDVLDAWQGEGEPLIYGEYQRSMKPATMEAFQALKAKQV